MRNTFLLILGCVIALGAGAWWYTTVWRPAYEKKVQAESLVKHWAEKLNSQRTESGSFIRYAESDQSDIEETLDPWGQRLCVTYTRGGMLQTMHVRSAGPDGKHHTHDDIVRGGYTGNLSGIGSGIKKNVEETAENATRGATRGIVQGLRKEGVLDRVLKKSQ